MALSDMIKVEESPASATLRTTCKDCRYFSRAGFYRVDGKLTPCSDPSLGRLAAQAPCPNYTLDLSFLRSARPETLAAITAAANAILSDPFDPAATGKRANMARGSVMVRKLALAALLLEDTMHAGYVLGATYTARGKTGKLVGFNRRRKQVTLRLDEGIDLTVDAFEVVRAAKS